MSDTKTRILEVALRQFNELGTDAVTVRSLAEEVGISHGNLCYHFKNTDVLIEALYLQLVEEMHQPITASMNPGLSLQYMFEQLFQTFRLLYRYRFLMLDFVRINRRIPFIRGHFRELMEIRKSQFNIGFYLLQEAGIMRPPADPGEYERLTLQLMVFGDYWISRAEVMHDERGEQVVEYYAALSGSMLLPYFTESGREQYYALPSSFIFEGKQL